MNPKLLAPWSCVAFVVVFAAFASGQDSAPELTPELRAEIESRIHLQRSFDGRLNSPGIELRGQEMAGLRMKNGTMVMTHEFVTKGLPSGLGFDFLVLPTMASCAEEFQSSGRS